MKVIGISGARGAGKTTLAHRLAERLADTHSCHVVALADPLKKMCSQAGATRSQLYGEDKETLVWPQRSEVTSRQLMQKLGQFMRELHPSVWIDLLQETIQVYYSDVDVVLVDDVRFSNEARRIQNLNTSRPSPWGKGLLIRLERCANRDGDISERDLDHYAGLYDVIVPSGKNEEETTGHVWSHVVSFICQSSSSSSSSSLASEGESHVDPNPPACGPVHPAAGEAHS